MAKRSRPVNRDQPCLFPPSMREWLPPGHPVWLVITAVDDHLDTSAFHAGRKTGGAGTAGRFPRMLVAGLGGGGAPPVPPPPRGQTPFPTPAARPRASRGEPTPPRASPPPP